MMAITPSGTRSYFVPGSVRVEKVNFKQGDRVKKGDVIATFDLTDLQRSLKKAELTLENAQLQYDDTMEDLDNSTQELYDINKEIRRLEARETTYKLAYDYFDRYPTNDPEIDAIIAAHDHGEGSGEMYDAWQALGAEEIVVIVMLNVKIAGVTGTLNICIPAENLEELIGNFNIKYSRSSKRREVGDAATRRKFLFNELLDTSLEVKAVLDESNLSLSDILQLQVDDVIPLNKNIQGDITVVVDGMPWYTGKMGETKTKKAVRLNELISESRERS